jgi:RNA polymerase sigma factor (sigma-70 family)
MPAEPFSNKTAVNIMEIKDVICLSLWYRKKKEYLAEVFTQQEAISVGYMAYMDLKERYDPLRGSRTTCFIKYLSNLFKAEMKRKQSVVHIPLHIWNGTNGYEQHRHAPVEFNTAVHAEQKDFIYDDQMEVLTEKIKTLSLKSQDILIKRYGLFNSERKTLKEIADEHNVTFQAIEKAEKRAVIKLRKLISATKTA